MATLRNSDGSLNTPMDPNPLPGGNPFVTADDVYNLYMTNFLNHYNGNRTPLGIFLHAASGVTLKAHVDGLLKFQSTIASQYTDVYWISNQKLLAWMQNPTDVKGALTSAALDCKMPATDPSNVEICDGIDNTGNGQIDQGLFTTCVFGNSSFSTCFGCPSAYPSITQPVPLSASGRISVPYNGCPDAGVWDPIAGKCVSLKRQTKTVVSSKNDAAANYASMLSIMFSFLFLMI